MYFDFAKAFDSVNHDILNKLKHQFKFDVALLSVFVNYRKDMMQHVVINGFCSKI